MNYITEREIEEFTKNMFVDCGNEIIGKHNPLNGEKDFVLCMIEQCVGLLNRDEVNDERLIIFTQSMISVSNQELSEYNVYLNSIFKDENIHRKALHGCKITPDERNIIKEMMLSNLGEYTMKSDGQLCCYTAMKTFFIALYCILISNVKCHKTGHIDLIVDLDDDLTAIKVFEASPNQSCIIVQWHSTNKINNIYTLYKAEYSGLEPESILDLVSADVVEEDYYFRDERFTIAPSILMKQYLSIIEREVNIIIQMSGYSSGEHLNWYDMKNRVRKKNIDVDFLSFKLHEALDDLYQFRNGTMHGEVNITCENYEVLLKYKQDGLFKGLSLKKLELQNSVLHPTVEEISKHF